MFYLRLCMEEDSQYVDKSHFEWTGGKRDQFLPCRFIAKGILPASVFQLLSSYEVAFRMCSVFGLWVIKAQGDAFTYS